MDWKEIKIKINKMSAEAVINILEELGARGVVLNNDQENRIEILAYYPISDFNKIYPVIMKKVKELKNYGLSISDLKFEINTTSDDDWSTSWYDFFKSIKIGEGFKVCPSWSDCESSDRQVIKIYPGRAFGIGSHESTELALENLEKCLKIKSDNENIKMLDIGTGTGILAIAAAKMGVKSVLGIDIDKNAVNSAIKNIKINEIEDIVKIKNKDIKDKIDIDTKYDLIVANLLPDLIINLFTEIIKYLRSGGILIISGIVEKRKDEIFSLISKHTFSLLEERKKNNWISLRLKRG